MYLVLLRHAHKKYNLRTKDFVINVTCLLRRLQASVQPSLLYQDKIQTVEILLIMESRDDITTQFNQKRVRLSTVCRNDIQIQLPDRISE
jgi:hypothetical protein